MQLVGILGLGYVRSMMPERRSKVFRYYTLSAQEQSEIPERKKSQVEKTATAVVYSAADSRYQELNRNITTSESVVRVHRSTRIGKAGIIKWNYRAETGKMQTVLKMINTFHQNAPSHTARRPRFVSGYTLER